MFSKISNKVSSCVLSFIAAISASTCVIFVIMLLIVASGKKFLIISVASLWFLKLVVVIGLVAAIVMSVKSSYNRSKKAIEE